MLNRPMLLAAAAVALLPLAACNRPDRGTSITINSTDGNSVASVDGGTGQFKLAVPGFEGKIALPKMKLDAGDFDLNGVHLYPGSTIDNVDIAAGKQGAGKQGNVRIAFTSPASPDTVRDWFGERLGKAGFTLHRDGRGLAGSTDEAKPFRLDLADHAGGKATGTIVLGS